ncbi:MAG: 1-deoxy-D-xylulose-5-phosphate synthase [Chloroflexi bacterium]|nr:1-deoxy-D-xylulose-5-phosphate synthase [Chloroflexota bacterium]
MEPLLGQVNSPEDIKNLSTKQMKQLADEIRQEIISVVSNTGGHLASSLGAVEIALALHKVFNSPVDKIIWDVGHQSYAHKIVTGRREVFKTLRQQNGISGFPKRSENPHDAFGTGHSGTSISAALGIAKARDIAGEDFDVVAVIGDGALTGGMAFEALNHAGHLKADMIVVVNDNTMSIAKNVGAMGKYLSKLRMEPMYMRVRKDLRKAVKNIPGVGDRLLRAAESMEENLVYMFIPGVIFESMGFTYLGPFDGHDVEKLDEVFRRVKDIPGPRVVHVITQKGKGYIPAERDSIKFHGAVPFHVESGEDRHNGTVPSYTGIFGDTLVRLAKLNPKIVGITAAMPDGTGLVEFSRLFPERFFDVGIAEQHAVTFSAALATQGFRPVFAIYSTFLQRGYDQVIHDVCLQNLPVVFAIDRAGLVGEDGPTHHGVFDISFLRPIPNIVMMAPKDEAELIVMLRTALKYKGPCAIRYPRGRGVGVSLEDIPHEMEIGKGETLNDGNDLAIIAVGSMVYPSVLAAQGLKEFRLGCRVINARFIKPLDEELILNAARDCKVIVTVEENVLTGGFGSAVSELISRNGLTDVCVASLGIPDEFIEHGSLSYLRDKLGLSASGIKDFARDAYNRFLTGKPALSSLE